MKQIQKRKAFIETENFNYIGNLQLIEGIPNQQKSNMDIDKWLDTVCSSDQDKTDYRKKHFIPDIPLTIENFKDFIEARDALIVKQLAQILID